MGFVPVADWAIKACLPLKGKKEKGPIIVMSQNINNGMNHIPEKERQKPLALFFLSYTPKQDTQ